MDQGARVSAAFVTLREMFESYSDNVVREEPKSPSVTSVNEISEDEDIEDEKALVAKLMDPSTRKEVCTQYVRRKARAFFESASRVQLDPNASLHAKGND